MLTIVNKSQYVRRFAVWDLEWVPKTYRLRLCGVYDSETGYRCYQTIAQFLDAECVPSNNGLWFYAHAGGLADLQFVLEEVIQNRPNWSLEGNFSNAACVRATLRHRKARWSFIDSYWLLRAPLREIAQWIGESKTGPTDKMTEEEKEEWYASVDYKTLRDYNRNDCEVLWRAIYQTQLSLLEAGGQLQATQASCAMQLFRRRYLTSELSVSNLYNQVARRSYFASRVEVIQMNVPYPGIYYDVNSSFPFAMTFPLPGEMTGTNKRIMDGNWDHPFIADCEIEVPDVFLPPIPKRLEDGRVFFPLGRWRGTYTGIDLRLLLDSGGRIIKVYQCWTFRDLFDLRDYALDLYAKRKKASSAFEKQFYKILLNSLYGKFSEQPEKEALLIHPTEKQLEKLDRQESQIFPGCFKQTRMCYLPHVHVPIASYITSIARRTLLDFMNLCSEVHICDTDGFSAGMDDYLPTGTELGDLKIEKTFKNFSGLRPKLYSWTDNEGNTFVKAKGFPKLSKEQFEMLKDWSPIDIRRMARIKENLRKGYLHPRDNILQKRIRPSVPKRFTYPDGYTRPWTIEELE